MRQLEYTVTELKALGRAKALELKDQLEDQNCNLDYGVAEEELLMELNNRVINLIEQIYIFKEI